MFFQTAVGFYSWIPRQDLGSSHLLKGELFMEENSDFWRLNPTKDQHFPKEPEKIPKETHSLPGDLSALPTWMGIAEEFPKKAGNSVRTCS